LRPATSLAFGGPDPGGGFSWSCLSENMRTQTRARWTTVTYASSSAWRRNRVGFPGSPHVCVRLGRRSERYTRSAMSACRAVTETLGRHHRDGRLDAGRQHGR
jgi:hypothetical protein